MAASESSRTRERAPEQRQHDRAAITGRGRLTAHAASLPNRFVIAMEVRPLGAVQSTGRFAAA